MKTTWLESAATTGPSVLMYSPQFNTIGGIETHLVNLSCFLAQRGWPITLVTTSGMLDSRRVAEMEAAGVEFIAPSSKSVLSVPRKALWLFWLVQTRLAKRHWDVVYTNAQGSLYWLLRRLKREGTRLIHHYHTAGDERDQGSWGRLFPRWMAAVDEVVACSGVTAENLRRVLGPDCFTGADGHDKMRVIRCLSSAFPPVPERRPRRPDEKLRFGFVGRLMRGKGIDMICQLSTDPDLQQVEWHLYGCGADYEPSHFEQFPNVTFHGAYNGAAELGGILACLDAVALFSRYQEGQPLSLVEAMSAGLPWIATDQGGTRELMWSADNCRLISAACPYEEARRGVLELAGAIRNGQTSFSAQRAAYDQYLSPEAIGKAWIDYLSDGKRTAQAAARPRVVEAVG